MFETFEANLVSEKGGQYFPPPHSPTHPPDPPSVTCSEKLAKPCRKCPRIADSVRDEHLTLSSAFWRLFCHESHRSVSQLTPNNPHDWFSISTTTFPAHATLTQYRDNAGPASATITPTLGDFFAVCATLESCVSTPSLTRSTSLVSSPAGQPSLFHCSPRASRTAAIPRTRPRTSAGRMSKQRWNPDTTPSLCDSSPRPPYSGIILVSGMVSPPPLQCEVRPVMFAHPSLPHCCACPAQQTQNICITSVQCRPNVFDAGPTLYTCYTNVLPCLSWCFPWWHISVIIVCDQCSADPLTG